MSIVPIDLGFGYIQAIVNGQEIKFPNIVGNYRIGSGGGIDDSSNLSIKVNGLGEWNFGETAIFQSSGGGSRPQSNQRIFSTDYLGAMLLAISEGYSSQTRDVSVDVFTGLPGTEYNQYASDISFKNKFKNHIQGTYHIERPGYRQKITIKSILCTHQAWGAIWRHLIDDKGNPVKPDVEADSVLIGNINVGYQTVEIGTVNVSGIQNGGLRVRTASGIELSEPDGVHRLIFELRQNLTDVFNMPFGSERAIEVLENGGLILDGQWQKYKLPNDIRNDFNSIIFNHMSSVYSDTDLAGLYRLINSGGGANITKNRFAYIPQILVSERPQWDTCIGYSHLAKKYSP